MSVWAAQTFKKHNTNVNPTEPTIMIVSDGPFSYSRNPMYLSLALIYLGFALIINDLLTVLILIPVSAILNWYIIPKEEKYLEAKFGDQHRTYRNKVRKWL